jgi:gamma-glutamylcysteine synthetase
MFRFFSDHLHEVLHERIINKTQTNYQIDYNFCLSHKAVDITKFAAEVADRTDPNSAVYLSLIEVECL